MAAKDLLPYLQILVTVAGMYLGPKLAIRYSLRQFRSQKWWERQEDAYTTLLEDLSTIYSYHANTMDGIERGSNYKPGPDVDARLHTAKHRLEQWSVTGAYIISDKAAEALRKYQLLSYRADSGAHPYDACRKLCDAAKECLEAVKIEAEGALIEAKGALV